MGRPGYGKVAMQTDLYHLRDRENKITSALESWQECTRTISRLVYGRKYKAAREMAGRILSVGPWYQGPIDTVTDDYAKQAKAAYDAWLADDATKEESHGRK